MKDDVQITLPTRAIPLLLKQRSRLRTPLLRRLEKYALRLSPLARKKSKRLARSMTSFIATLVLAETITRAYRSDLLSVFSTFVNLIPQDTKSILDIGAGMGGINCLTYHAVNTAPEIWLLDKQGESKIWNSGFHEDASDFSHYNSFELATAVLESSGIPKEKINCVDIGKDQFPDDKRFDVIYSFLSCGFHYPVETYAEQIARAINPNGLIVFDIRKGTVEKSRIAELFSSSVEVIYFTDKYERVAIRKNST